MDSYSFRNDYVNYWNENVAQILSGDATYNLIDQGKLPSSFIDDIMDFLNEFIAKFNTSTDELRESFGDVELYNRAPSPTSALKPSTASLIHKSYDEEWSATLWSVRFSPSFNYYDYRGVTTYSDGETLTLDFLYRNGERYTVYYDLYDSDRTYAVKN